MRTQIFYPDGKTSLSSGSSTSSGSNISDNNFVLKQNKQVEIKNSVTIASPTLWSPDNPANYIVRLELWRGDQLIDRHDQSIALFVLESSQKVLR